MTCVPVSSDLAQTLTIVGKPLFKQIRKQNPQWKACGFYLLEFPLRAGWKCV